MNSPEYIEGSREITQTKRAELLAAGWSENNVDNMLKYNTPFYMLGEIIKNLNNKKGVIDSYGRYKQTVA